MKVILVYFLGGVTFAEIGAIRWLNEQFVIQGRDLKIIIATTQIITGGRAVT